MPAVRQSALARWFGTVFGALTLAFLAVGYVLPVLHFTLVAHELCAEHGALHHVESVAVHSSRSSSSSRTVLPAANAQHEHEHCGVVATGVERALLPEAPEFPSQFVAVRRQPTERSARAAHVSLALLDYAPKLAPPV